MSIAVLIKLSAPLSKFIAALFKVDFLLVKENKTRKQADHDEQ